MLLLGWSIAASAVEVVKSPSDHRDYKHLELSNGLRALIISDPDTDKAAASLSVEVGSASDPDDRLGLAHFLEHMLFLGTKKYSQAGEYDEFMNAHAGSQNAYTAFENTNYHFDIDKDFLEPALDRFSQFFIAPLFTAEYVQREKNAVHSEYKARIQDDERRAYAAMQQVVNPAHPFSRFTVGSLQTLSDRQGGPIRDQLIQFYETHYSANLMTLAVLGKEPLPVLEKWVREKFSAVQNRNFKPLAISAPLFKPGVLPLRLNVEPRSEQRTLELFFPIPALRGYYRQKPVDYIANLLGHEGPGSLLSVLKSRGWAESLGAGLGRDDSDGAAMSVSMQLTEAGLGKIDDIVALVFATLHNIDKNGVSRWRFDEQARLAQLAFQFDQKDAALGTVIEMAETLPQVAPGDALQARFLMLDYDAALIHRYLGYLRPDNMMVTVTAKGLHTDKHEAWYDTAYASEHIEKSALTAWRDVRGLKQLHLPKPNPFIPRDTTLKPLAADATPIPKRIISEPGFELWFKQDENFHQPRADFYFSVRTPLANDSAEHAVLASLYTQLVSDELNEFSYAAQLAGLSYAIYPHIRGFTVRISGYNDKIPVLLSRIVNTIRNPAIADASFARQKQTLVRVLENTRHDDPYEQTLAEVAKLLVRPNWSEARRLEAARKATAQQLREFVPRLLDRIQIIALAHGNLLASDATQLCAPIRKQLLGPATPVEVESGELVQLEPGKRYLRDLTIDHPDSVIDIYFQGSDRSAMERARFELLAQVLEAPFYNQLRTEKQLGYVVNVGSLPLLEVPGISFLIQSPTTAPLNLQAEIESFLQSFHPVIANMTAELFEEQRAGLVSRIRTREERLQQRTDRYWTELDLQHYAFDGRERLAAAAESITREDLLKTYERVFLAAETRRLTVSTTGADAPDVQPKQPELEPRPILITDPDNFSTGLTLPASAAANPAELPRPHSSSRLP